MKAKLAAIASYLQSEESHEDVMDTLIIAVGGFILLLAPFLR